MPYKFALYVLQLIKRKQERKIMGYQYVTYGKVYIVKWVASSEMIPNVLIVIPKEGLACIQRAFMKNILGDLFFFLKVGFAPKEG